MKTRLRSSLVGLAIVALLISCEREPTPILPQDSMPQDFPTQATDTQSTDAVSAELQPRKA